MSPRARSVPLTDRRVAILIHQAVKQGGLEKYAQRTAAAFAARGCQVSVMTFGPIPRTAPTGVTYLSMGSGAPLSALRLWQFDHCCQRALREQPHDVVFAFDRVRHQTHLRAGNGVHAAYLQQRALTDSWHKQLAFRINPLHRSLLYFERKALESPDLRRLFTNSRMVRDQILNTYSTAAEKISVVHNGVEWTAWQEVFDQWPDARARLLAELQLPPSAYYLLFVGHGYRRKGLGFLLQGLAHLRLADVHLLVVGKEREQAEFQTVVARLGLQGRVHFLGPRNDVLRFYQAADALVVPSIYDPFANVTLEGLAMGLYTVSSRFNGGSEVLTPGNGTMIERLDNAESMAAALQQAIDRPKSAVSARGIRDSVRGLDFSRQLDELVTLTLCKGHNVVN